MDSKTERKFKMWQLLENGRQQLGISKKELYRGIQVNMKHQISDQVADSFDKLTWDYLLGRIGISNLIFEGYIHAYEFDLYQLHEALREKTNQILYMHYQRVMGHEQQVDPEKMYHLLLSAREDMRQYQEILYGELAYGSTAVQLHVFFLKKMEGYLLMGEELLENTSKTEERKALVQEAWAMFREGDCLKASYLHLSKHFLAPAELECLLQAAGVLADAGQLREAEALLQKLWAYKGHHAQDLDEEVKIYPYAAWMLAIIKYRLKHTGATALLEQGIELLARAGRMNGLVLLMEALISAPDYTGDRDLLCRQKDALEDLAGIAKTNIYGIYPLFSVENMIHVNDLIKQKRLEQGKTQQELADGVISWERYSKFECEHYNLSWDKISVFLMELDLPFDKQWITLDTDQPEVMRAYVQCKRYIHKHQYELMDEQFHQMKPAMDQSSVVNRQYITHIEGIIEEEICVKDCPGRSAASYEKLLKQSIPAFPEIRYDDMLFGSVEQSLVLDYIYSLDDGLKETAIMEQLVAGFEKRKGSSQYQSGIQRSIRGNYYVFVGLFRNHSAASKQAQHCVRYMLENGNLQGIIADLYGYASEMQKAFPKSSTMKSAYQRCRSYALLLAKLEKSTFWIRVINSKKD
jgi:hypothetical protein